MLHRFLGLIPICEMSLLEIKKEGEISSSLLSRRRDLDPRPRDYKSRALPLSYAGNAITFRFASAKIQHFFKPPNIFLIFFIFSDSGFLNLDLVFLLCLLKVLHRSENQ